MSKVNLPQQYNRGTTQDAFDGLWQQVDGLSDGRMVARRNALTSIPTTGTYGQGDFVPNSAPSEAGTVGGKYIVTGWICVVGGSPGTFKEARVLTGG